MQFWSFHFLGSNEKPSENTVKSIEDPDVKPKEESPAASNLSLMTPMSEEPSLSAPVEKEMPGASVKVHLATTAKTTTKRYWEANNISYNKSTALS